MTATVDDLTALGWRIRDALTELRRARLRCQRTPSIAHLNTLQVCERELDDLIDRWPR